MENNSLSLYCCKQIFKLRIRDNNISDRTMLKNYNHLYSVQ